MNPIPSKLSRKTRKLHEVNSHVHQCVGTTVEGGQVVIKPFEDLCLTLAQRVAAYDVKRHGGEQMTVAETVGAEKY